MADQIVLAWTVNVAGTPFSPAQAATALAAIALYQNATTDPVLGGLFGLTVDADATVAGAGNATRTLTLNMNAANAPEAPPPFPCLRDTATPPTLPYTLRRAVALDEAFFATTGSVTVLTAGSQLARLAAAGGDVIEFASQPGVYYTTAAVTVTQITLTAPFTGLTGSTEASEIVANPVVLAAIYSTCDLDTNGVATTAPAIPAGPGALTIDLTYDDSVAGGPFTVQIDLLGKQPVPVVLDPGSIDIAVINNMVVSGTGGFNNSIGQITLVEVSDTLPVLPLNPTPADVQRITDERQALISRHLAFLPPSYFAIAQQQASFPELEGDFLVTTGSTRVITTVDQSAGPALVAGNRIRFASQLAVNSPLGVIPVFYTVATVAPRFITLEEPYTGFDTGGLDTSDAVKPIGSEVIEQPTAAYLVDPSPAVDPTDNQLSGPLAQFVSPATAGPPPFPPLTPVTVPTPTFLSGLFTRTISLALAVPVAPAQITFLP